jgi:hypothetical protein
VVFQHPATATSLFVILNSKTRISTLPADADFGAVEEAAPLISWRFMKHSLIGWNPGTQEYFCTNCGRTSEGISVEDAQERLEPYECEIPSVDAPRAEAGMKNHAADEKVLSG